MALTPKNNSKQRPFVDRKICLQKFKEAVYNIRLKEFSVLVYYGVAGIGKTSLKKEFMKYLEKYNKQNQQQDATLASILKREIIWTSIDLQLDKYREKNTFLVTLKNDLQKKHKIDFPAFEIAHDVYWKKANPTISLKKDNHLLFEGNNASDDILGIGSQIPYLGMVPHAGRFLLSNLPDHFRKWRIKRREKELKQLSEKEPWEIEEMLPYFWAQDLNNYLKESSKTAVLFIDTYEAMWEKEREWGNFNGRDKWIRELISNLHKSSLFVICGKEELRWKEVDEDWNNYLKQYKLEKLPEEDTLDFLNRCGIKEQEIQEVIVKASEGVPYYLDLAVNIYTEIAKASSPKPYHFPTTLNEIFYRFMKYLNVPEQETLKVLSTPRFWNKDIFRVLINHFNTCYPITAFSELNRFSFIQETENKLQLHPLMRESLQVYQDQDLKKEVHNFMLDFYSNQLKDLDIKAITLQHKIALNEAFYHAKKTHETKDLLNWFIVASGPFNRAAL